MPQSRTTETETETETVADETMEKVAENNKDLAKRLEFFKTAHRRIEYEKFQLLKENNELVLKNRLYKNKIEESHAALEDFMLQSLRLYKSVRAKYEHVDRILKEFSSFRESKESPFGESHPFGSSPSTNVHHVQPMIGGVPLKTPILKVPRANINTINGRPAGASTKLSPNDSSPSNSSSPSGNGVRHNFKIQNVSVCLKRLDRNDLQRAVLTNRNGAEDSDLETELIVSPGEGSVLITHTENPVNSLDNKSPNVKEKFVLRAILKSADDKNDNSPTSNIPDDNSFPCGEEEYMEDVQYSCDYVEYASGLECIVEETESDILKNKSLNNSSLNSSKLWNTLSKSNNTTAEDPLEGPSWKIYNNSSNNDEDDTLMNNIKQMSDSMESNDDNVNFCPTTPKFTSTPKPKDWNVCIDELSNSDKENLKLSMTTEPDKSNNTTDETKSDKTDTGKKRKGVGKKSLPRNKVSSKSKLSKTSRSSIGKRSKSSKSSVPSFDSSLKDSETDANRPRRGIRINYKEKSLGTKLRRE